MAQTLQLLCISALDRRSLRYGCLQLLTVIYFALRPDKKYHLFVQGIATTSCHRIYVYDMLMMKPSRSVGQPLISHLRVVLASMLQASNKCGKQSMMQSTSQLISQVRWFASNSTNNFYQSRRKRTRSPLATH